MKNQALQRREEVTARILPLTPPPIPRARPRVTAEELGIDDQFAAYQVELDEIRRRQQATAGEITTRIDGVEDGLATANHYLAEKKRDIVGLKQTAAQHATALRQHAGFITRHDQLLEKLRAEVEDNDLLAASQERLEELETRLEARIDEIETRETSSYAGYGMLAREIASLKRQLRQLHAPTSRVKGPRPDWFMSACAWVASTIIVASLLARFILF